MELNDFYKGKVNFIRSEYCGHYVDYYVKFGETSGFSLKVILKSGELVLRSSTSSDLREEEDNISNFISYGS